MHKTRLPVTLSANKYYPWMKRYWRKKTVGNDFPMNILCEEKTNSIASTFSNQLHVRIRSCLNQIMPILNRQQKHNRKKSLIALLMCEKKKQKIIYKYFHLCMIFFIRTFSLCEWIINKSCLGFRSRSTWKQQAEL